MTILVLVTKNGYILQRLLETNILTEDVLRSAHDALANSLQQAQQFTTKQKEEKRSETTRKKELKIDLSNLRTRHVALRIYYDGGAYSGLAENVGQASDQSVERALFQALQKAQFIESRETCGYSRCGRTDRGVSAAGQVVALRVKSAFGMDASFDSNGENLIQDADLPSNAHDMIQVHVPARKKNSNEHADGQPTVRTQRLLSEYPYDRVLNNLLPKDVRVVGWCPVSDEFSARFSAATRTYRYFFYKRHMNLGLMDQALQLLVGNHDFRNFCKMDVEKVYNFERVIYSASIVEQETGVCYMMIHGQAFLWHQIRCIAEILFLVGREKESPSIVLDLLNINKHPRKPSYPLADERPLVLHDCGYKKLQIQYSVQNLWAVTCLQEKQWEDLMLTAARIRNSLNSLKDNASVLGGDLEAFAGRVADARKKRKSITPTNGQVFPFKGTQHVAWSDALQWIHDSLGIWPGPNNEKELAYAPLMSRSKGTTYEEKVEAAMKSARRNERYVMNVVKKRKSKEEDIAFYKHMANQGNF
ncbi:hypothetical protein MPSEU_000495700 [Mayamaea pseudoterrestris]|nr:hypothetical protein MPSEU_000495700 [Mayamaea pseudoterrestris]